MPVPVQCGFCDATFHAADSLQGKTGNCPNCKALIAVPFGGQQAAFSQASRPPHAHQNAPAANSLANRQMPSRQFGPAGQPPKKQRTGLYIGVGIATFVTLVSIMIGSYYMSIVEEHRRENTVYASRNSAEKLAIGEPMIPDALIPVAMSQPVDVSLDSGPGSARLQRTILTRDRKIAFAVFTFGLVDGKTSLELIDLEKNEHLGFFVFNEQGTPFAVTSDARGLFTYYGTGRNARVDLWSMEDGGEIVHQRRLNISGARRGDVTGSLQDCNLLNDQTLYIRWENGYSLVDVQTGDVFSEDEFAGSRPVAFSANGKYMAVQPEHLAVAEQPKTLIINCETMKLAGQFDSPTLDMLAFSESGKLLAGITPENFVVVLDARTGAEQNRILIPDSTTDITWAGDEYLILPRCVLDVLRECPVETDGLSWTFRPVGPPQEKEGYSRKPIHPLGHHNFLPDREHMGLHARFESQKRPRSESLAMEPSPDDFYLDLAGKDVAIEVGETWFDEDQAEEIRDMLAAKVEATGARVVESSQIRVVCKTVPGSKGFADYIVNGRFQQLHYDRCINLIFIYDGAEMVWQDAKMIEVEGPDAGFEGEVRTTLARSNKPNPKFYEDAQITSLIPRKEAWGIPWRGEGPPPTVTDD